MFDGDNESSHIRYSLSNAKKELSSIVQKQKELSRYLNKCSGKDEDLSSEEGAAVSCLEQYLEDLNEMIAKHSNCLEGIEELASTEQPISKEKEELNFRSANHSYMNESKSLKVPEKASKRKDSNSSFNYSPNIREKCLNSLILPIHF